MKTFKQIIETINKKSPLYVSRPVLNTSDIISWAKEQGFDSVMKPEDMHVTIVYSKTPVSYIPNKENNAAFSINNGARKLEEFDGATVLQFECPELQNRWKQFIDKGASWDYDNYNPHITLTYKNNGVKLSEIEPYSGIIKLGKEISEPLDVDKTYEE